MFQSLPWGTEKRKHFLKDSIKSQRELCIASYFGRKYTLRLANEFPSKIRKSSL